MEIQVRVRIKENGAWTDAFLSAEDGKPGVTLKMIAKGEKIALPADDVAIIKIPNNAVWTKEQYTSSIVLTQKALQAGFKVAW